MADERSVEEGAQINTKEYYEDARVAVRLALLEYRLLHSHFYIQVQEQLSAKTDAHNISDFEMLVMAKNIMKKTELEYPEYYAKLLKEVKLH